jgi:hypothetical protein
MTRRLEDLKGDSCLWCDGEIDLSLPFAITRLYCSSECRIKYRSNLARLAVVEAKRERFCAQCGGPISLSKRGDSKFCSYSCGTKAMRPDVVRRYPLTCEHCGSGFAGHFAAQRFCCVACSGAAVRARRQAKVGPTICQHCSTAFHGSYATQRFCSVACANALRVERAKASCHRVCSACSAEFEVTRGNTKGACCPKCRRERMIANLRKGRIRCEAMEP